MQCLSKIGKAKSVPQVGSPLADDKASQGRRRKHVLEGKGKESIEPKIPF